MTFCADGLAEIYPGAAQALNGLLFSTASTARSAPTAPWRRLARSDLCACPSSKRDPREATHTIKIFVWQGLCLFALLLCAAPTWGAIDDTLRGWYAAEARADVKQSRARVTPDAYVFDAGKRFNGDALLALRKSHLDQGDKAAWTISERQGDGDRGTALATFTTCGSFAHAGKHHDATFLEAAWLKKADGHGRIAFFHSMQVPERSPAVADSK